VQLDACNIGVQLQGGMALLEPMAVGHHTPEHGVAVVVESALHVRLFVRLERQRCEAGKVNRRSKLLV